MDRGWWVVAALVLGAACGAGTTPGSDELAMDDLEAQAAGGGRELTLEVENQNFYDATLYAVTQGAGHRQRLGYIQAYGKRTLKFHWLPTFELRIEIVLETIGSYLTPPLAVEEGDDLQLIIEPDLHRKAPVRR